MSIPDSQPDGRRVVQIQRQSVPKRGDVVVTDAGRPYRVARRYDDGGGGARLKLKGRDSNNNVITLFPLVLTIHNRVNEKGWNLYR